MSLLAAPDVAEQLRAIVAHHAGLQAAVLPMDLTPEAAGLDSLARAEILFAIEEQFNITLPIEDQTAEPGVTLAQMIALLADQVTRLRG